MKRLLFALLALLPTIAFAAPLPPNATFKDVANFVIGFINLLIPLIIGLTVLVLFWGIIQAWILNGGDEESVNKGKKLAGVGVLVLVVMFGIWGILSILKVTLFGA